MNISNIFNEVMHNKINRKCIAIPAIKPGNEQQLYNIGDKLIDLITYTTATNCVVIDCYYNNGYYNYICKSNKYNNIVLRQKDLIK